MQYCTTFQERDINIMLFQKAIFFVLLINTFLYSAVVTDYKIYKEQNGVSVLILLDSRFEGEIYKEFEGDNFIKYKITKLTYHNKIEQEIKHQNIQNIAIVPNDDNSTTFSISTKTKFSVEFSKIADGANGLRFNITTTNMMENKKLTALSQAEQTDISYGRYFMVIGIMAILIIILIVVKRKVESGASFSFKKDKTKDKNIDVIYQKNVDIKTKIMIIKVDDVEYVVLSSPSSMILLDKFDVQQPKEKENFTSILNTNQENIQRILNDRKK